MRVSPPATSALVLGALAVGLAACVPVSSPLKAPLPIEGTAPGARPTADVAPAPAGTVVLTVIWPERRYAAQAIPLRTNALRVQVFDSSDQSLASTLLTRPGSGAVPTTTSLSVPAGANRRIVVKAFQEETPGFDSTPIAEGSTTLTVQPSTEVTADLALVPVTMPAIATAPTNAGPLSVITLTGSNFEGWGQPVEVRFGGVLSPHVAGTSTQLTVVVPAEAEDGPLTVTADGLTATNEFSFRLIKDLSLSPQSAVASAGQAVDFVLAALDRSSASIPTPNVTWGFEQTYPLLPPASGSPPTTLVGGRFTPGATGSFEIRVSAGSLRATASVTVN